MEGASHRAFLHLAPDALAWLAVVIAALPAVTSAGAYALVVLAVSVVFAMFGKGGGSLPRRRPRGATWLLALVACLGSVPTYAQGGQAPPPAQAGQDTCWAHLKNLRFGPATLDIGGQVRARFEDDNGFTIKGYEPGGDDQLLLERVRLDFSARFSSGRRIVLQLQDAHAFLTRFTDEDFPQSSPIEDTLDIRQLYAEWPHVGGGALGFRIGRQQISDGDQRVFGPGSWGNTGRFAWDAAMLTIDTARLASDFWVGRYLLYKSGVWPDHAVDNFLTFVNYTQVKNLPARLDLFYVLKHDTSGQVVGESGTANLLSHTVGLQIEGRPFTASLDAGATVAAQVGRHGRDNLRAFGASGKVGLTLPTAWKPRIGGQYTWGSGDSNPTDGVHGTFDGVYGGRDIFFYGYLNLFFWANLRDAELDLRVTPHRALTGFVEFHHFALDRPTDAWYTTGLKSYRRDPTGRSGTELGQELDLRLVWNASSHLELMVAIGQLLPGALRRQHRTRFDGTAGSPRRRPTPGEATEERGCGVPCRPDVSPAGGTRHQREPDRNCFANSFNSGRFRPRLSASVIARSSVHPSCRTRLISHIVAARVPAWQ